jgi:hypothetical protein
MSEEYTAFLFWGETYTVPPRLEPTPGLSPGTYRVICGLLYRIEPGLPPVQEQTPDE